MFQFTVKDGEVKDLRADLENEMYLPQLFLCRTWRGSELVLHTRNYFPSMKRYSHALLYDISALQLCLYSAHFQFVCSLILGLERIWYCSSPLICIFPFLLKSSAISCSMCERV